MFMRIVRAFIKSVANPVPFRVIRLGDVKHTASTNTNTTHGVQMCGDGLVGDLKSSVKGLSRKEHSNRTR